MQTLVFLPLKGAVLHMREIVIIRVYFLPPPVTFLFLAKCKCKIRSMGPGMGRSRDLLFKFWHPSISRERWR